MPKEGASAHIYCRDNLHRVCSRIAGLVAMDDILFATITKEDGIFLISQRWGTKNDA